MAQPTFMVIGAQKCGTTWLAEMLRQHPQVASSSEKELHFFNKKSRHGLGIDWYESQFAGANGAKAIGEYTPNYLWTSPDPGEPSESDRIHDIPALVHQHYPDLKLIALLRDPVRRAVSSYHHHIRHRRFSPRRRIFDVGDRWGIITMGYYREQLEAWSALYPPERMMVLLYEDSVVKHKAETLDRVCRFLEIDEGFRPADMEARYNVRHGGLYLHTNFMFPRLARRIVEVAPAFARIDVPKITVSEAEEVRLADHYAEPNRRLAEYLGRDLPWSS